MRNMNKIGTKYDITMFEWFEKLVKAEKRLAESIECNKRFGDNEEWIKEDTNKVNSIKQDIEEVKIMLEDRGIKVDYERLYNLAKKEILGVVEI